MKSVLEEVHADKIAFAHHQGDNAETVLMNLCRGSQVKGMRGILPVAGEFIHPLLCVGKSEIEEALSERGVSWRIDATNFENDYTRNRVRNQVMGGTSQNQSGSRGTYLPNGGKNVRVVGIYGR